MTLSPAAGAASAGVLDPAAGGVQLGLAGALTSAARGRVLLGLLLGLLAQRADGSSLNLNGVYSTGVGSGQAG